MAPRRSSQHKRNGAFWLKASYNVLCIMWCRNSYPIFQPLCLSWPVIICENFDIDRPSLTRHTHTHTHTHTRTHWLLTICDVSWVSRIYSRDCWCNLFQSRHVYKSIVPRGIIGIHNLLSAGMIQPATVLPMGCSSNTFWVRLGWYFTFKEQKLNTVITRLTSDPANEFFRITKIFFAVFFTRLTNVLVDARANIKQQTWTVGPFHERSSINFGHIFYFSFSKETEASYWRTGDLPWINFEKLEEE